MLRLSTCRRLTSNVVRGALTCVAGCVLGLTYTVAQAQDIAFKRLLTEGTGSDYNVGSIVTLARDRQGFIWIGAEYGLARFDGQRTTHYPLIDSASGGTYVNDITVDGDGRLWVATERGFHLYNEATGKFTWLRPFPQTPDQNRIAALAADHNGQIILARPNGISIYQPDKQLFKHFELPGGLEVPVVSVMVDHRNNLWLGTHGAGVALFDQNSNRFSFYQNDYMHSGSLADDQITIITEDPMRRIWVGTKTAGLSRLDPGERDFKQFRHVSSEPNSLGHNYVRDIYVDSQQLIWVATDHGGLSLFNEQTQDFRHFTHNSYNPKTLASNQIRKVLEDKAGDLWVGTFPLGLNYFNRAATQFTNYWHHPERQDSLSHSSVLCFLQTSDGALWVGTENGLNQFHAEAGTFTRYMPKPDNPGSLQAGAVISLAEDASNQMWVGTWSGGLHRFNLTTREFINYKPSVTPGSIGSPFIWALLHDSQQRLWVGTEGAGLHLYRPQTDDFQQFQKHPERNSINHNDVWSLLEDHEGQLWVGTTAGLNRFNPDTGEFYNFPREPNNPHTVDSERIRALFQDSKKRIWIGTQEAGIFVYNFDTGRFLQYTTLHGLPAAYVTGFVEDDQGFIWASTADGAVKIHPRTMTMTVFNKNHGLIGNNLYRNANFKDAAGRIYLGSTEGFSVFNPSEVSQYEANAQVHFTRVSAPVTTANGKPLKMPELERRDGKHFLALSHLHSVFDIEFSALDFRSDSSQRYAYKLAGFEHHWNEVGNIQAVTYTNLSPGNYTFLVKAGTLSGWSPHVSELHIAIKPPPWRTWWAFAIYALAGFATLFLIIHAKMKQVQLVGEREVNNQLRNLNALKDAFLANTSHELRTPLNGIIGIAETLREREVVQDAYTRNNLDLIITSGKRLASLINDILDHSKLANNKLVLNTEKVDMYTLTQTVFTLLEPLAKANGIMLVNNVQQHLAPFVMGDENRLQQIMINLVGNGIKYTPKGSVTVDFTNDGRYAQVTVSDTGLGIVPEKQLTVFDAFSQGESDSRTYDGTGLGLAITKQLVEMHGGKIRVESTPGHGSKFIVSLPAADEKDAKPRPLPPTKTDTHSRPPAAAIRSEPLRVQGEPRNAKYHTVLIVDDDSVNRMVLQGMLNLHNYNIVDAASGAEALALLKEQTFDMVILDVMMPGMTGYETCKLIRERHALHELPVLFLTAKAGDEDITTCFEVGGNDYLTKPINKNDLLARVANHLRIQAAIRKLAVQSPRADL